MSFVGMKLDLNLLFKVLALGYPDKETQLKVKKVYKKVINQTS